VRGLGSSTPRRSTVVSVESRQWYAPIPRLDRTTPHIAPSDVNVSIIGGDPGQIITKTGRWRKAQDLTATSAIGAATLLTRNGTRQHIGAAVRAAVLQIVAIAFVDFRGRGQRSKPPGGPGNLTCLPLRGSEGA
jgi:hypothetical protein